MTSRTLDEQIRRAMEVFNALTPEQQRAHRREQAISWMRGELLLKYGEPGPLTDEQLADIYDRRQCELGLCQHACGCMGST